jgi:hypothetical protein
VEQEFSTRAGLPCTEIKVVGGSFAPDTNEVSTRYV